MKKKYILNMGAVVPVYEIDDGVYVPTTEFLTLPDDKVFESRKEALYSQFLKKLLKAPLFTITKEVNISNIMLKG